LGSASLHRTGGWGRGKGCQKKEKNVSKYLIFRSSNGFWGISAKMKEKERELQERKIRKWPGPARSFESGRRRRETNGWGGGLINKPRHHAVKKAEKKTGSKRKRRTAPRSQNGKGHMTEREEEKSRGVINTFGKGVFSDMIFNA